MIQKIVDILNEAYKADPKAIETLFRVYVTCNEKLAEHPTIEVKESEGDNVVGFLALINGFVDGKVGAMYNEKQKLIGFTVVEKPTFTVGEGEEERDLYQASLYR